MPARPSAAAAEETIRRARGSAASQRGRHSSDVAIPLPSAGGAAAGGAGSDGNVDWDAIFRTIDGQAGQVPVGQGQWEGPEQSQGTHRRVRPASLHQGLEFPQGLELDSMAAGPSLSSQQRSQSRFPNLSNEPRRHPHDQEPWSADPFNVGSSGFGGLGPLADLSSFGQDESSSHGPGPPRPPQPNRSQSYPFYSDPFHPSPPADPPSNLLGFDQQRHGFMPPPPTLGQFGLSNIGTASEPNSFGSGSGASIASLLNNPHQYSGYNFTPLASPAQPLPGLALPRGQSMMDPPPPGSHRPNQSTPQTPFNFSGQSSVNPSPAPTPLSNPTSGEDSEDKRVRNTVASAKFRAKKKEQIASVQRTISELEVQQAGLEADVASLRNENGLLREMVQIKFGTKIPEN